MLKAAILIFYITGYKQGGPAVAEFQTMDKCERVHEQLIELWGWDYKGKCFEK